MFALHVHVCHIVSSVQLQSCHQSLIFSIFVGYKGWGEEPDSQVIVPDQENLNLVPLGH